MITVVNVSLEFQGRQKNSLLKAWSFLFDTLDCRCYCG